MKNMDSRPDPEVLLKTIKPGEAGRGNLKIFLGYAAGVGKTFAMLEAAHQRKDQGVDVIVGFIETHNRAETEGLLEGLEILPRRSVEYRSMTLPELDVDAVLARRPELALIDEFAHSNAPGSRHPRRYQDVEEILEAGIDVYTTLNIQHLESLNDVVAQVTGVIVRETVPDIVIDEASEIEVVDLPPDELLTRLSEGKVYIPDQAARAIRNFFRKGNLTALREMSLRRAAERVDGQMRSYMQMRAIAGPWAASDRLMVCISPGPLAEKLVRNARRLADELNAEWFAVYVEAAYRPEINPANRERIDRALLLAAQLGAKTQRLPGSSMPQAVLEFARRNNITKVVVGKPQKPRWQELWRGSLIDQLIRAGSNVDVYVVSSREETPLPIIPQDWQPHRPVGRYLMSAGLILLSTLLGVAVRGSLEPANLVMLYLASVVISAIYLGRGPSLLASILGVVAFDFFLVPPYLTLAISDTQYLITFAALFLVSIIISTLTARVREQAEASVLRESQTAALYSLGRDLTSAADLHDTARIIIANIGQAFSRQAAIFLPMNGNLGLFASSPDYHAAEDEQAVASWVFEHREAAGRGTDTLPDSSLRCHPLITPKGIVGVLGIRPGEAEGLLTPEQRQVLAAFANQAALAVERASLAEQARQAELLQATEKLQTALLNSISHDLRTPLVSITGAVTSLDDQAESLTEENRRSLINTAREEAERLNRLVGNLLSMTRIASGAIRLHREPGDVQDVIGTALEQLGKRVSDHEVAVSIPEEFPLVPIDFSLIVQAVVNLLENAAKYSPGHSRIEVNVSQFEGKVRMEIADRGVGIPEEDLKRVFDKFYRIQRPEGVRGTGLGLSISKGIVEAHGGSIQALQREGGGTVMRVELPLISPGEAAI